MTLGRGLLYEDKGNTQIFRYCDADWVGSPMNRRSTAGYCVLLRGNIISWKSKKQKVVVRSSTKVEYREMASFTYGLIWVNQFLQELDFYDIQPMKIYCDKITKRLSTLLLIQCSTRKLNTLKLIVILFEKSCCLRKFALHLSDQMINLQMYKQNP